MDEQSDKEVQMYLLALREAGGSINCAIAKASATGIIRQKNSNWLACNGGHILLTKDWSRYLLERMHFVKRKANTKAKIRIENFTELKCNYSSSRRYGGGTTLPYYQLGPYCPKIHASWVLDDG